MKVKAFEWTGPEIQTLRRTLGETIGEFGDRVGRSGRTVEDWEQGRRRPDILARRIFDELLVRRKGLATDVAAGLAAREVRS